MTAIWINEKTGAVRVGQDRKTAEHNFGNAGKVYETSDQLAADGTIPTGMLVTIYNEYAGEGKTIKKFSDRKTAADRTFKTIVIHEPETASKEDIRDPDGAIPSTDIPPVPATTAATKSDKRGAKGKRNKRIFPIDGKDPFKSGASAVTWQMIKKQPGKTFADYIAMGGRANTIAGAIRNGWVRLED